MADPTAYRPLSGLALSGLIVSALYAAVAAFSLSVSMLRREPFLLPTGLLLAPIAGALLALLGRRQIRNSEGTRAGEGLAKWGLWLGVLSGLGYLSYSYFTGLAVRQQADRFLTEKGQGSGFFQHLKEGNVDHAFLLTLTPSQRAGVNAADKNALKPHDLPLNPDKDFRGPLSLFRDEELVQIFREAGEGKPVEVQAGGLRSWDYEKGSYRVERLYRILNEEAVYEVTLAVRSSEGAAGEGRRWQVEWSPGSTQPEPKPTELGEKRRKSRDASLQFAQDWLRRLAQHDVYGAYFGTRLPEEREALSHWQQWIPSLEAARDFARTAGLALPGGILNGAALPVPLTGQEHDVMLLPALLPGFDDFLHGRAVLSTEKLKVDDKAMEGQVRDALAQLSARLGLIASPPKLDFHTAEWKVQEGRVRLTYGLHFAINTPGAGPAAVVARLTVDALPGADAPSQWRAVSLDYVRGVPLRPPAQPGK